MNAFSKIRKDITETDAEICMLELLAYLSKQPLQEGHMPTKLTFEVMNFKMTFEVKLTDEEDEE